MHRKLPSLDIGLPATQDRATASGPPSLSVAI
jgi:hypothetical protein